MHAKITYQFSGKVWKSGENAGWVFVSLPKDIAKEIRKNLQWQEEGWGRMKATAITRHKEWETAIWIDKKQDTYLLPLKAEIRKKASIKLGDIIEVEVKL